MLGIEIRLIQTSISWLQSPPLSLTIAFVLLMEYGFAVSEQQWRKQTRISDLNDSVNRKLGLFKFQALFLKYYFQNVDNLKAKQSFISIDVCSLESWNQPLLERTFDRAVKVLSLPSPRAAPACTAGK